MIRVVCYSGGHSSAIAAIETVRKYGKENTILLNHDISSHVEHEDIKRFKRDVADYLDLDITYCNANDFENRPPLKVCVDLNAFQYQPGKNLCTKHLKTDPFHKWLKENFPVVRSSSDIQYKAPHLSDRLHLNAVIIYGFDATEKNRVERRSQHLASMGYGTDFPLYLSRNRTIEKTEDIGIPRPVTYSAYKHANCIGCLKAGKQHWYCVFCERPDIWEEAKAAESCIGHHIVRSGYLTEFELMFKKMRDKIGVPPTDKGSAATFWAQVKRHLKDDGPCDCTE